MVREADDDIRLLGSTYPKYHCAVATMTPKPDFSTALREKLIVELRQNVRANIELEIREKAMKQLENDVHGRIKEELLEEAKMIVE